MPLTEVQLASIKKRLCNPPFESVAANGDPMVCGLFSGVGDMLDSGAADVAPDDLLAHYLTAVVEIEMAYATARRLAADNAVADMNAVTLKFMEALAIS